MKKHLKSVISFVVALGLAAGSVASMAASYSDVATDAGYAESVANLSAIGILTGYDDGTFKPDANITRAEVATVVVRAMAQEAAANSSKGATQFTDVAADHWASGYINVASAGSTAFINGMGDGTFAPDANVTYAQTIKMLVSAIGYGDFGIQYGGWPTGYITAAKNLGILDGITGANADDLATRGLVAQLTNNAINTPLMGLSVFSMVNPEYEILDGEGGRAYETVLTSKHNIYTVEGRVIATNKTTGGSLDADKVRYQIENTKNYGEDAYVVKRGDDSTWFWEEMYVGETDAADYLNVYSKALVYVDDSEDAVILSIIASGKNQTAELDVKGYDDEQYDSVEEAVQKAVDNGDKNQIWFYSDGSKKGKSSRYYLAENFTLYVNGVEVAYDADDYSEDSPIVKYIFNNDVGTITLVDTPAEGSVSTDGKYDAVFVSYYGTAIIDTITADKIYFSETDGKIVTKTSIDLDWDDDNFSADFKLDGKDINYEELKEGDVLSIAFDVEAGIENSAFYDVLVSRNVAEGKIIELNAEDGEITIGDDSYGLVDNMTGDKGIDGEDWDLGDFEGNLGNSYTVYLDAFNRIVDFEKLASTVKYGILHRAYDDTNTEERKAIIYDTTANQKNFVVDEKMADTEWDELKALSYENFDADTAYGSTVVEDAYSVDKRVIEYTTNSKGEIKSFTVLNGGDAKTSEYKAKSNRLAGLTIGESTVIISMGGNSKTDYNLVSKSNLVDGTDYTAFGYDRENSVYPFVLIVDGIGSYTTDSRFAVVEKTTTGTKASTDDDCDKITLYTAGSKSLQTIDTEEKDQDVKNGDYVINLQKGDVIIYKTNASGEITDVELLFSTGSNASDYDQYATDYQGSWSTLISKPNIWDPEKNDTAKSDGADLVIGVVVDKSTGGVSIATDADEVDAAGYINIDNVEEYGYASDVAVYVYDFNNSKNDRLQVGTTGSVVKKSIPKAAKAQVEVNGRLQTDDSLVDLVEAENLGIKFPVAVAKIIDDDTITDLLIIIPKD